MWTIRRINSFFCFVSELCAADDALTIFYEESIKVSRLFWRFCSPSLDSKGIARYAGIKPQTCSLWLAKTAKAETKGEN
jgi:hypothetical protein